MDYYIEEVGKNIEEATKKALERMNATREQVKIEVLENHVDEHEKESVRIKATAVDLRKSNAENFINKILKRFKLEADIIWEEKDAKSIMKLYGEEMGILIGNNGKTLEALQLLMSATANRNSLVKGKIFLDIEDYKERKIKTLEQHAKNMAGKAIETGEEVVLKPMIASERRIIHNVLTKNDEVITISRGEEPDRQVIITPVRKYDK